MIQTDNRTAGTHLSPTQQCLLRPHRIHDNPCTHSDMCSAGSGYSCLATDTASKLRHEFVPHQATLPAHLQCRREASPGGRATQMERSPSAALSKAYAQPSKIPRLTQANSSAAPQQQPSKGTAAFLRETCCIATLQAGCSRPSVFLSHPILLSGLCGGLSHSARQAVVSGTHRAALASLCITLARICSTCSMRKQSQ